MYRCPFCGKTAVTLNSLRYHVKKMHDIAYYCPICNRPFKKLADHCYYLALKGDIAHMALWYLVRTSTRSASKYIPLNQIKAYLEVR